MIYTVSCNSPDELTEAINQQVKNAKVHYLAPIYLADDGEHRIKWVAFFSEDTAIQLQKAPNPMPTTMPVRRFIGQAPPEE